MKLGLNLFEVYHLKNSNKSSNIDPYITHIDQTVTNFTTQKPALFNYKQPLIEAKGYQLHREMGGERWRWGVSRGGGVGGEGQGRSVQASLEPFVSLQVSTSAPLAPPSPRPPTLPQSNV